MNIKVAVSRTIPTGQKNAILLDDLARQTNFSRSRIKEVVQELRDEGEVILSGSSGGYFRPTQDEEGADQVSQFISMMLKQAKSRMYRIRSAKRWLREYKQVQINNI